MHIQTRRLVCLPLLLIVVISVFAIVNLDFMHNKILRISWLHKTGRQLYLAFEETTENHAIDLV